MITSALVLPTPRALLPPASAVDPIAELRAACVAAVAALPADARLLVVAPPVDEGNRRRGVTEPLGHRVARALLGERPFEPQLAVAYAAAPLVEDPEPAVLLVMGDGSARRTEKAPGHLHPGAVEFDEQVETALRTGDADLLGALDPTLGEELWCQGVPSFHVLAEVARGRPVRAEMTYADAPYGVAWWVARWDLDRPDGPQPPG